MFDNNKMNSIVKMLQYVDNIQPALKNAREIVDIMNRAIAWQKEVTKWYNAVIESGKFQYGKVLDSIKSYLNKEGKILPVDDMAFLEWFFEVQHPDLTVGEPLPTIEQKDFILFHVYQDEKFKALIPTASTPPTIEQQQDIPQLPIAGYAILHVYLARYGGQPITKHNQDVLANQYGYTAATSGKHLYRAYMKYKEDTERTNIHTTSKRSAKAHMSHFNEIFPILKSQSLDAYSHAQKDFEQIERLYNKYYS